MPPHLPLRILTPNLSSVNGILNAAYYILQPYIVSMTNPRFLVWLHIVCSCFIVNTLARQR